tara:strand:+ start:2551 stop:2742 length:192 start_codon:yes stop_codon:yes gene_type:complete
MENILIPLIAFIGLLIIRAQMLQKIKDKERYPGIKIKQNKPGRRGNVYTQILRFVLPKKIKSN